MTNVNPPLPEALRRAHEGVLFYGVTPPRLSATPERADEVAAAMLGRLAPLDLDALMLYDVDAEDDRAEVARPFPFTPMMDPAVFRARHLSGWRRPVVVYRAVGKYDQHELRTWLTEAARDDPGTGDTLAVLVGASSTAQAVRTTLSDAYRMTAQAGSRLPVGGVVIAERHESRGDEHLRLLRKQDAGCSFFVSQICYDLDHTRNLLSDYVYACRDRGTRPNPVILTLAACGSVKTLDFMTWLGIEIPRWLRTDIARSEDPLQESYEQCVAGARLLIAYCRRIGLPFGIGIESVTNRKVEIEASVELAREVQGMLGRR
jgi:hypothetical protein